MFIRDRIVGAWGKNCARQTCRYEGQSAAHGQITERKPSVPRFRFYFTLPIPGEPNAQPVFDPHGKGLS